MLSDPLATFAAAMAALPSRHPRRLALLLAQVGLFVAVGCFSLSIAGMNIGLVTCLIGCVLAGAPLHRCLCLWPYLIFCVWMGLSLVTAGLSNKWIANVSVLIGIIVAQVAFHPLLPGAKQLREWVIKILVITIVAGVCLALAQYVIGKGGGKPLRVDPNGPRFFQSTGFFSIHLTQGAVMGMLCLLVGGLAVNIKGWWCRIAQGAAALGVVICGARAAWLGFVAAVSITVAVRGKRYLWLAGGIGLSLMIVAFMVLRLSQPERLERMLAFDDGRWPIWHTSVHVIWQSPLLGAGGSPGYRAAYEAVYPLVEPNIPNEFLGGAPHAHNTQLSQAAEHGIPLAVLWLIMLGLSLWYLRRSNPTQFRAGIGMATMALVFGQFENLDGEASRVLWTGLGMLLALRHETPTEVVAVVQPTAPAQG
jgi:O-antigen ligase